MVSPDDVGMSARKGECAKVDEDPQKALPVAVPTLKRTATAVAVVRSIQHAADPWPCTLHVADTASIDY